MSTLIPEPINHPVEIVASNGPWDGPTRHYRGARIEANDKGTLAGASWRQLQMRRTA